MNYYKPFLAAKHQSFVIEEIKGKTIKIIDSTTVSLCLKLFDWAKFRTAKGGLKIHTVWDESLALPDYINITEAKVHDSRGLTGHLYKKGTIIVEDRGYYDFSLMKSRVDQENIFVTRIKDNTVYESVIELELPDDKDQHILKDELIYLNSKAAQKSGIDKVQLRRVVVYDEIGNRTIEIITNQLDWEASTIGALYMKRWAIELFFKALKQNLQIKTFVGTSENAVKSQIYVAMICYLLLELIRRVHVKGKVAFRNFCEKIRICIAHYQTLNYICSTIKPIVDKVKLKAQHDLFNRDNFSLQTQLFSP